GEVAGQALDRRGLGAFAGSGHHCGIIEAMPLPLSSRDGADAPLARNPIAFASSFIANLLAWPWLQTLHTFRRRF
ncbi:hypothetical protein, partial [Escherichia coli]|uniref:hypothetical protein n=1 Tax=Escherichia coli TaxID=562 RepID=UPI0015DB50B9